MKVTKAESRRDIKYRGRISRSRLGVRGARELRTVIYRVITPNVARDTEITRAHLSDRKGPRSIRSVSSLRHPFSPNTGDYFARGYCPRDDKNSVTGRKQAAYISGTMHSCTIEAYVCARVCVEHTYESRRLLA